MTDRNSTAPSARRDGGPHPGILAAVVLALTLAGLIAGGALSGGAILSSPFTSSAIVGSRLHENWEAARIASLLQFGSAVPLGIFAATMYARLQRLGVRVPGPNIGFFGGVAASISLMASALIQWVLSRPEITTDATLAHALSYLSFGFGGVGFVVGMGLLLAGMAVPALILRLVPRWLAWAALVIAALSELSFLSLAIEPLQYLLPVGRFGGLVLLVGFGFWMPRGRVAANQR